MGLWKVHAHLVPFFTFFLKKILLSMKSRDSCLWIWATRDMNTYLYSHIPLWSINFLRCLLYWPRVLSNCNIPFVHTATQITFQLSSIQHYISALSWGLCKLVFSNDNYMLLTVTAINETLSQYFCFFFV